VRATRRTHLQITGWSAAEASVDLMTVGSIANAPQAGEVELHVRLTVPVWSEAQQLTIVCYFSESPNQSKAIVAACKNLS